MISAMLAFATGAANDHYTLTVKITAICKIDEKYSLHVHFRRFHTINICQCRTATLRHLTGEETESFYRKEKFTKSALDSRLPSSI
jgi:hypothetical protein